MGARISDMPTMASNKIVGLLRETNHHLASAAADRIEKLEAALSVLCDSVERIAFEMPPPNEYTPQFVQRVMAVRALLRKSE